MVTPNVALACVPQILEGIEMQRIYVASVETLLSVSQAPHFSYTKAHEEAMRDPILVLHPSGSIGQSSCPLFERVDGASS